jgi:hypothetical protein
MDAVEDEKVGACWECGYSLRGLPTPRCPECGRVFDPADEKTMNMGVVVGSVKKWLMRPPGWPVHLLTAGALLMSLWACAVPMRRHALSDLACDLLVRLKHPSWIWGSIKGIISDFGNAQGRFLIAVTMWLLIGGIWTFRRIARGITVHRLSKQKAATFAYWRRWLVTPVVFGSTILIGMTQFPTWAGFWLSKP